MFNTVNRMMAQRQRMPGTGAPRTVRQMPKYLQCPAYILDIVDVLIHINVFTQRLYNVQGTWTAQLVANILHAQASQNAQIRRR